MTGFEEAALLAAAGEGAAGGASAMGALGTASLFGPSSAGLSSLASSALGAGGLGVADFGGPMAAFALDPMKSMVPSLMGGEFAAPGSGMFSEMAPFANPMMKSMVPSTLGGDFTAMSASPFQSGLPWQKMAKLGGQAMLMDSMKPQPTPPMGAAPSASGPQGAPASLFNMPQISAGAPLGGAQAMQARLQGMDPMMMLRMQQRGY